MTDDSLRSVRIERTAAGRYRATNPRGGDIVFGSGDDADFTPVELLLAALGGCTAIDVDIATSRHAEPSEFTVAVSGNKISDELGAHMTDLEVRFRVTFPDGKGGDDARKILPRAVKSSHDRLCTVSRTIEIGTPVSSIVASGPETDTADR
ncbi:OsmC family protein [Nocardia transvalensis]|uniref:OsmC family protein n=1 Tax=Nocardia transvalensis TaxID=37333 RepID=UPI001895CCDF|nr:OsmC family protein [Nocardia transvalensis]MBF6332030.1 OsmC family protein [Nocardia transvalensis]